MSTYAEYVRERLGDEILEGERGFLTYRFLKDGDTDSVYIVELYVRPDYRRTKVASEMADQIVEYARSKGCKRLLGTVNPSAKNATDSLKVLLGYGMTLYRCDKDVIVFRKEI